MGGVNVPVEEQIRMIENNKNLSEAYKARKIALLKSQMPGAAPAGPPGAMNRVGGGG